MSGVWVAFRRSSVAVARPRYTDHPIDPGGLSDLVLAREISVKASVRILTGQACVFGRAVAFFYGMTGAVVRYVRFSRIQQNFRDPKKYKYFS